MKRIAWSLPAIFLCGCMVGPNYQQPKPLDMPQAWLPPTSQPTTHQSVATTEPADVALWWANFNDPELDSLIDRAMQSNLDLQQATQRIRQARASRTIAASPLWPQVNSFGGFDHSGTGNTSHDLYQAGLDAAWELDIFGGLRRDVEASTADIQAAVEDRRDVMVTLVSEVALDYIDLRGFQREIDIAQENLVAQEHSAALTRKLFGAGFNGALDVANADADVASTQSQIPLLEQSVRQTIYALSVLLGRQPAALLNELSNHSRIPRNPPAVPVGLPSELLRRRPDIRRAEAQLHAATARIGVATADLFPQFSLTGSLGYSHKAVNGLFDWNRSAWSIGPTVSWPVFDAGKISANIEVQNALQQQALLTYQQSILTALQDVENALIAYEKEQQHHDALVTAVQANRRAVDISTQLYTQGQTDFLNVLTAQRSLYGTEDALVQSDRTMATNLISLYKALGGGWEKSEAK